MIILESNRTLPLEQSLMAIAVVSSFPATSPSVGRWGQCLLSLLEEVSPPREEGRGGSLDHQEQQDQFLCVLFLENLLMAMGCGSSIRCDLSWGSSISTVLL